MKLALIREQNRLINGELPPDCEFQLWGAAVNREAQTEQRNSPAPFGKGPGCWSSERRRATLAGEALCFLFAAQKSPAEI